MSGVALVFGRIGPDIVDDQHVVELLQRTVEGQYQATLAFDAESESLKTQLKPIWTQPISTLTLLHSQWLSAMLWQMATSFLDGVVKMYAEDPAIPEKAYQQGDMLCDQADAATLQSVEAQTASKLGSRPLNASLVDFPDIKLRQDDYVGSWNICCTVVEQVTNDLEWIEQCGIPSQMQSIHKEVMQFLQPQLEVFRRLRQSWEASTTSNQLQLLKKAVSIAKLVFEIGQKLWAPYLFGHIYKEALTRQPTLDELEIGIDPWLLTDPLQKQLRQSSQTDVKQLTDFWLKVANPTAAKQLSEQLDQAVQSRRIRRRHGKGYNQVPWQSQFLVRFPVKIGDRTFTPGQLIAFYPSADGSGKLQLEVKGTGRLTQILDLLGQREKE